MLFRSAAVGVAEVTSDPRPDPKEDDERLVVIDLKPKKKLPRPVTLSDFKADKAFQGWDLLRISRLSVMPVPPPMWKRIEQLGSVSPDEPTDRPSRSARTRRRRGAS